MGDRLLPYACSGDNHVGIGLTESPSLSSLEIAAILRKYGLRPDKSLGQNFLQDEEILRRVSESAGISFEDSVLEIGPGLGSLTRYLANSAREVVVVELDGRLIPILNNILGAYTNIKIFQGDILKIQPAEILSSPGYLVVANIPYYITSAIFRHLLENHPQPKRIVLTIQKEVAERICAQPGNMSLLALSVQVYGRPEIVMQIPKEAFYPVPKVDSTVIRVDLYDTPSIPSTNLEMFFRLAKAGFSQKRKTLRNALSAGLALDSNKVGLLLEIAEIDSMRRAETLSLNEWGRLCEIYQQGNF